MASRITSYNVCYTKLLRYAVTSPTSPLHEIPPGILKPVTQGIFYFQDKRLFGMEMNDLAMLTVQTPAEHYVLINQHDEWVLEDNPSVELDQQVVRNNFV